MKYSSSLSPNISVVPVVVAAHIKTGQKILNIITIYHSFFSSVVSG